LTDEVSVFEQDRADYRAGGTQEWH
jgi:hypothetical protein